MSERTGYPGRTNATSRNGTGGHGKEGTVLPYGNLRERAREGVFEVDAAGRIVYANNAFARVYGYASAEAMKAEVANVGRLYLDSGSREELLSRIRELGGVAGFKSRVRRNDGEIIWVLEHATGLRGEDGELLGSIGTVRDVTEEMSAERAVFESEEELQSSRRFAERIADTLPAVLYVFDLARRRFRYVNDQVEKILGYRKGEWLAMEWSEYAAIVHPEHVALLEERIRQLSAAVVGNVYESDYPLRHKNGEWRSVRVRETAFGGEEDERPGEILGMVHDITELRRTQNEREAANQQLRALSERLEAAREEERAHLAREFHDQLGQELTGMKMDLKWIALRASKIGNDPVVQGIHERTEDIVKSIDRMIHSVRSIATSLRPAVLDECGLGMAIEWQASEFERRSGIRCVVVNRWSREFQDPALATALFRIFQEILTNVARHAGADRVNVLLKSDRAFDIMEVSDNGRGITPSEISKSLGILGMRERAAAFGGKLEIKGKPGEGTTVRVRLAREAAKPVADQRASENPLWWLIPRRSEK